MSRSYILIGILLLLPGLSGAATLRVPDQYSSIQFAYLFANQGDTILVAPGSYTGPLIRGTECVGKAVCLISESGSSETILDFDANRDAPFRGFWIDDVFSQKMLIRGFTFRNAYIGARVDTAGALYFEGDSLEIVDCVFENNYATTAGAAFINASWLKLDSCIFANNGNGAVIATVGSIVCTNSTVLDNDGTGLEITATGLAAFSDCRFESSDSRALKLDADSVYLGAVAFDNNSEGASVTARQAVLDSCTFSSSGSQALVLAGDTVRISKTGFVNNSGTTTVSAALITVDSCTFSSNSSRALAVIADTVHLYGASFDNNNGAVSIAADWILADSCHFSANSADTGVLLDFSAPTVSILRCRLDSNTALAGALVKLLSAEVTLEGCSLTRNSGNPSGGVTADGTTMSVTDCTFAGNAGDEGGAINAIGQSHVLVENSVFIGNQANSGGAIFASEGSQVSLDLCEFTENRATFGGVFYASVGARIIVEPAPIYDNSARWGGVLYNLEGASATFTGCNMFRNGADSGGVFYGAASGSDVAFVRCLIAFGVGGGVMAGVPPSLSCCVIFRNWDGDWTDNIVDQLGVNGNSGENPLFCDYGSGDYGLDIKSLCAPANNECGELIGLHDVSCEHSESGPWHINPDGTGDAATIQDAINQSGWADTVILAPGIYRGVGNRDIDFEGKNIAIFSESGPESTIIDCEGTVEEPHRAFYIHSGASAECRIEGLTIRNGFTFYTGDRTAGAVEVVDASPTFVNCVFENSVSCKGGALRFLRSSSTLIDCRFYDNRSKWGGAVAIEDGNLEFQNCEFERNLALDEDSLFGVPPICTSSGSKNVYSYSPPDLPKLAASTDRYTIPFNLAANIVRGDSPNYRLGLFAISNVFGSASQSKYVMRSDHLPKDTRLAPVFQPAVEVPYYDKLTSQVVSASVEGVVADTLYYQRVGGGAIHAMKSTVSLRRCQFLENRALNWGAGIYCYDSSSVTVDSCTFTWNRAGNFGQGGGAAVALGSTARFTACSFEANYECSSGGGIALDNLCQALIQGCTFKSNQARAYGGGIALRRDCLAEVIDCSIVDNGAYWGNRGGYGCGLFSYGSQLSVSNTRISRNRNLEGDGTGLAVYGGRVELSFCEITHNVSQTRINPSSGGGVYLNECGALISNCTISDNAATWGGNISLYGTPEDQEQIAIVNSILSFADKGIAIHGWREYGEWFSVENCNIFGNLPFDLTVELAEHLRNSNNVSEHPLFCDRYGGNYHIAAESTCLPENNQSGQLIGALGAGCDLEPEIWHVKADGSGESTTIQAAINLATHGDTIAVGDGTYTGEGNFDISFRGKLVVLTSNNGPEKTVIDCQANDTLLRRGFLFEDIEDHRAVVRGFTITGGFTKNGAGIFSDFYSSPTIIDCIITGDTAWNAAGGVIIQASAPVFENCVVSRNLAAEGGGFYLNMTDSARVFNCTLVNNSGKGGGLYTWNGSATAIANSIIALNKGGTIFCDHGEPPSVMCTAIFDNQDSPYNDCLNEIMAGATVWSHDPQFCDAAAGNYGLFAESPCSPSNNSCGVLIGAVGVGCDPTDVEEPDLTDSEALPKEFALSHNYPNPFNPATYIDFALPQQSHVELVVYNILGQQVISLADEDRPPGEYTVAWHGEDSHGRPVSTGVYFYRIKAGEFVETRKMLLLK